ncbi:MAG: helix-turn-helix domain-containing protein [Chloroflexales bacterium]|nr:helix-turn-helix domain-containing protein [Chloroflexales bacterium]
MSDEYQYPSSPSEKKVRHEWDSQRIKALREYLGLTQREMADELEVRQQTISEWETGLHKPHRSTQKTLTMVAERAGFAYEVHSPEARTPTLDQDQAQAGQEEKEY